MKPIDFSRQDEESQRSNAMPQRSKFPKLALVALSSLLFACGGGSGVGSGGTGTSPTTTTASGTETVAVGPISGFGSIIVNGVKYDDSAAGVTSDDRGGIARSDLRLGMFVEVRGTSNTSTSLGTASSVLVRSELKGTVQNRTATSFSLLGVTVRTDANTVYDNTANVVDGDFVEVYGVFDTGNRAMLATRIEKKILAEHKLRGLVSALDTSNRRFNLGAVLIDYSNAGTVTGLANGVDVQVYGAAPPSLGAWPISRASVRSSLSLGSATRVELESVIEQFTSLSNFRVSGLTVDGSSAVIEGGTVAQLVVGRRVEIKGDLVAGVLKATRLKIEDGSDSSSGSSSTSSTSEFEVKGRIETFVSSANFTLRGTRVNASGTVSYEGGTFSQLAIGACVEVKGVLGATASGSVVTATRIKFDNDC